MFFFKSHVLKIARVVDTNGKFHHGLRVSSLSPRRRSNAAVDFNTEISLAWTWKLEDLSSESNVCRKAFNIFTQFKGKLHSISHELPIYRGEEKQIPTKNYEHRWHHRLSWQTNRQYFCFKRLFWESHLDSFDSEDAMRPNQQWCIHRVSYAIQVETPFYHLTLGKKGGGISAGAAHSMFKSRN